MIILSLHWPIAAILFAANLIYVTIRFKTERSRKIKWILIGLYSVLLVKFVVFPIVLGEDFQICRYKNQLLLNQLQLQKNRRKKQQKFPKEQKMTVLLPLISSFTYPPRP